MTIKEKYKGVIVPMVTPLNADHAVDKYAVERIVNLFVENDVKPFILGSTGEAASVSRKCRLKMVKCTVSAARARTQVFAGISGNCVSEIIEEGQAFSDLGIDVLVATPPYYYPMNSSQMIRFFSKLADSLPKPLILYNMPGITRHSIPLEVVDELSLHDNIVGLKDSERNDERMISAIKQYKFRTDFVYLLGWAARSATALKMGADGIVPSTGNLTPELYRALYLAAQEGDDEKADCYQELTNKISSFYQKDKILSESIPALKVLMNLKGLCSPDVLPPMYRINIEAEDKYADKMRKRLSKLKVL